jgi:hypothetical protein
MSTGENSVFGLGWHGIQASPKGSPSGDVDESAPTFPSAAVPIIGDAMADVAERASHLRTVRMLTLEVLGPAIDRTAPRGVAALPPNPPRVCEVLHRGSDLCTNEVQRSTAKQGCGQARA